MTTKMSTKVGQLLERLPHVEAEAGSLCEMATINSERSAAFFRKTGLTAALPKGKWKLNLYYPHTPGRLKLYKHGEYHPSSGGSCYSCYISKGNPTVEVVGSPTKINAQALNILASLVLHGREVIDGYGAGDDEWLEMESGELADALWDHFKDKDLVAPEMK